MKLYQKILVMGAGGVGGYFGGRLAERTTADVTFIARGNHLRAIQQNGLQLESIDGNVTLDVQATDDPRKISSPDLVLFTVKSFDTVAAIKQIKPIVGAHTQVLTIQNGVENYPKLVETFGGERVIQGFCKISANIAEPGVIKHKALGKITIGEEGGKISARLEKLRELFQDASIPLQISDDISREVWLKFAWNSIFNMLTAVADVTVEKLFMQNEAQKLCYKIFGELKKVSRAEGVSITQKDGENIIESAKKLDGFTTSTYQDRQKGKKLEYDAFTGAILRLAEKHNIAVPHNETLYALLKVIDEQA